MADKRPIVVRTDKSSAGTPLIEEAEELAGVNAELIEGECATEDDIVKVAKEADVLLVTSAKITRRVMESLPNCKAIVRYGIGYDTVDVEAATDNNILVVNVPDFCFEEVSNHAILLLLACAKKLVIMDGGIKKGLWKDVKRALSPMGSIWGETLGIIGCGNIGRTVAQKAQCFNMNVIGTDPYVDKSKAEECGITLVSLPEFLKQSDYISLHPYLSKETHHLLGEKEFQQMKPSAYVINTSRGPVIDEPALIKALKEKWIAGAGLDVFEQEPIAADNPLLKMDNVVVFPHTASYSDPAFTRLRRSVGQETVRVLSSIRPKNVVNAEVKGKIPLKTE